MKHAYSHLGLVLLCMCILVWTTQANPIQYGEEEEVETHPRERRDMHGLFDLIGDIFKKDTKSGKSQAGGIFDALLKSIGALGKELGGAAAGSA